MKHRWPEKTIGEVCQIINGGTPKTNFPDYWDGKHLWITPAEMGKRQTPYVNTTARKITDLGLQDSSARLLPPLSVILSSRAPIGHLVINTEPMATNQGCKGLIPGVQIDHKYLYHFLSSATDHLNDLGSGTTFKELSGSKLREVALPLPPLPEQHRIVRILDEAFDGIATAKANAEKNHENARAVFQSHLEAAFTAGAGRWKKTSISEVSRVFEDGDWVETKDQSESGIRLIQTGNIGNGVFRPKSGKARFISPETFKRLRCTEVFPGDCLISRLPDPVGRSCILPDIGVRMITAVDCTIVRLVKERYLTEFFVLFTRTNKYRDAISRMITGTTRDRVSRSNLGTVQVPLAPLADQLRVVEDLEAVAAEIDHLAALYARKLSALDDLKKSLLHQAFSGAL